MEQPLFGERIRSRTKKRRGCFFGIGRLSDRKSTLQRRARFYGCDAKEASRLQAPSVRKEEQEARHDRKDRQKHGRGLAQGELRRKPSDYERSKNGKEQCRP